MTKDVSEFLAVKYEDITLTEDERNHMEKEVIQFKSLACRSNVHSGVPEEVSQRYQFSNYVVDPNRHRFRDVVRLVAIIYRFINNCRERVQMRKSSKSEAPVLYKQDSSLILSDDNGG